KNVAIGRHRNCKTDCWRSIEPEGRAWRICIPANDLYYVSETDEPSGRMQIDASDIFGILVSARHADHDTLIVGDHHSGRNNKVGRLDCPNDGVQIETEI